jgi:predicted GIY-YIG superfamily endonuclease
MSKITTENWEGISHKSYSFNVYTIDTSFKEIGAIYIFTKDDGRNYTAIYIGETENLKEQFDNHERMDEILENGATKIHIHSDDVEKTRKLKEEDLIKRWKPLLNTQNV